MRRATNIATWVVLIPAFWCCGTVPLEAPPDVICADTCSSIGSLSLLQHQGARSSPAAAIAELPRKPTLSSLLKKQGVKNGRVERKPTWFRRLHRRRRPGKNVDGSGLRPLDQIGFSAPSPTQMSFLQDAPSVESDEDTSGDLEVVVFEGPMMRSEEARMAIAVALKSLKNKDADYADLAEDLADTPKGLLQVVAVRQLSTGKTVAGLTFGKPSDGDVVDYDPKWMGLEIHLLGTSPAARGTGAGTVAVAHVEQWGRKNGRRWIFVFSITRESTMLWYDRREYKRLSWYIQRAGSEDNVPALLVTLGLPEDSARDVWRWLLDQYGTVEQKRLKIL